MKLNMKEKIISIGKIGFEPENITKKHNEQSSWKHIAMVFFEGDITEYYAWFIKKRYNLVLNKPIRGAHISFINDSFSHMSLNGKRSIEEVKQVWENVKNRWDGIELPIMLDIDPRSDGKHWWLNVSHEYRDTLHGIRAELCLGKPFWGLHMSLGYANEKWLSHSRYIHNCIKSGLIN